jgi:arylsulfatase A-like enzyme
MSPGLPDSATRPSPQSTSIRHVSRAASYDAAGLLVGPAGAIIALGALLGSEAVVVSLVHHRELAGAWELRIALFRLVPIALLAGVPLALLAQGCFKIMQASQRRGPRGVLCACAAIGSAAVGWGVSGGRHLREIAVRSAFILAVAAIGAAITWASAPRLAAARKRASGWFMLGVLAAVIGCHAVNIRVLPRLYPAFHLGLSALGLMLGVWLGEVVRSLRADRSVVIVSGALITACIPLSVKAVRDLPNWDNVRVVYLAHAPWLSHAVVASSLLSDTGPSADPQALPTAPSDSPAARRWIDWTGRDILLISIDALRADHVTALGYGRNTTPAIDALVTGGVVFENAYCAMPHTSYSITSLMTGKYMRPLLLQRAGEDSETLARLMRTYGYRTAAFYPPAVFAIDPDRFAWVESRGLDFEYRKVEYASADKRLDQVRTYLSKNLSSQRLLLWVHLFEPHEPYEAHAQHPFGDRDIDRYDSEVAAADAAVGELVREVRAARPATVVILTADHGEEFGEHGGYYHGTTVYEEQVRVPLLFSAQGLSPRRIKVPVQLVDVLPTLLHALDVPRSPRLRGNDLGPWLGGQTPDTGMAFSESDDHTMLAEDRYRLVCERRVDACSMFDVTADPLQTHNISAPEIDRVNSMRKRLRELAASHGRYELSGARQEGRALPAALRRGVAGDADAAGDVAALLDDADVVIRRKAAEVLFELRNPVGAPGLRLTLARDEDDLVRRWCALALTRLGQGAPRTLEMLQERDANWSRLAALALAEAGDPRAEAVLIAWWEAGGLAFERAREIVAALGHVRSSAAVVPLSKSLGDVRLRPYLAAALAEIGDPYGRIALMSHFPNERYETSRRAMAEALVKLGATREMAPALARFLGVPDPLPGGVDLAIRAHIVDALGGPSGKALGRLQSGGMDGLALQVVLPKGGNSRGTRCVVRGRSRDGDPAEVRIGRPVRGSAARIAAGADAARFDPDRSVAVRFEAKQWQERTVELPDTMGAAPGRPLDLIVMLSNNMQLGAFVIVPLADEIPAPPPEPWTPRTENASEEPAP